LLKRHRPIHQLAGMPLAGEEVVEPDQGETLGERRRVALLFRQLSRFDSVGSRPGPIADRLRRSGELELDLRPQFGVLPDLIEGLLRERERRVSVVAVVADPREEEQRLGPKWTRGSGVDRLPEARRGLREIRSFERVLPPVHQPVDPRFGISDRRQLTSQLYQLSRGIGGAALARSEGGVLQLRGHALIRSVGGKREVSRSFFLVGNDARKPAVDVPPFSTRGFGILNGPEERVSRSQTPGALLDHTCFEGSFDVIVGARTATHGQGDLRGRRLGGGRRD
jgi:hypothetical protein